MNRRAATRRRRGGQDYDHLLPLFERLAELDPDDAQHAELREELITAHLPVAEHIAQRFAGRRTPKEDLVQVATIGLINAVDRFQPERGSEFLSFAVPTVMGEVRRHFRDTAWSMRVPRRLKELHLMVAGATGRLAQRLGRAPTPGELVEELQISKDEVYQGIEAGQAYHTSSLDQVAAGEDGEGVPLSEAIGDEDHALADVENDETLRPLIEALPRRERRVLGMRFFHNMTQTQIAERLGISQMHVSRLLSRTLTELREGFARQAAGAGPREQ